ncbi:HAD family hydrolase [Actinokineospora inagensis]|uniref:HAD family hydrolase n=1 Tax=Actinokineospora inagensis TaxID=103730 RepID=UPI000554AF7B|nr:HAD family hydrolase [Actinokineospora inagensis]
MRAVIFDWGGTLTPWVTMDHLAAWRAYADVIHPEDVTAAVALAAAVHAAEQAAWLRVRDHHTAFTLAQVLDTAHAPVTEAALLAFRAYWDRATHTDPEVAPLLTALRERGLRTGILSSTAWPATWHDEVLARDGVLHLFDARIWSSDLPHTKPHPAAFKAAMAALDITTPTDCVYIGDRPYDDITGAKAVGMRAILIPHSDIPPSQQVPTTATPDATLHRLSDLPTILDRWLP